jgi:hypothetical protein
MQDVIKAAEEQLKAASQQPGYAITVLKVSAKKRKKHVCESSWCCKVLNPLLRVGRGKWFTLPVIYGTLEAPL